MMSQMRTRGPEEISIHAPEAPATLQQVLNTALAFDPDKRFPSAAEFPLQGLVDAAEIKAGSVSTVTPSELPSAAPASLQAELAGQTPSETFRPNPPEASAPGQLEAANLWPLSAESLTEVERELANFVGPLARIAVQRSAKTSVSIDNLYLNLASYIDNSADQEAFLAGGQRRVRAGTAQHAQPGTKARSVITAALSPDALAPDMLSQIEDDSDAVYWSGRPRHRAATIVKISFAVRPLPRSCCLYPKRTRPCRISQEANGRLNDRASVRGSSRDEGLFI